MLTRTTWIGIVAWPLSTVPVRAADRVSVTAHWTEANDNLYGGYGQIVLLFLVARCVWSYRAATRQKLQDIDLNGAQQKKGGFYARQAGMNLERINFDHKPLIHQKV